MKQFDKEGPSEELLPVRSGSAAGGLSHQAMIEDAPLIKRGRGRPRKVIPVQAQVESHAVGRPVAVERCCPDAELLTTEEAAALTKMSVHWFVRMRWAKKGPPYHRRGRTIRYVRSELLAWWTEER